ncbi:MAG: glycosyltransferase family 4 protein [Syntrophales bacterium]
MKSPVKKVLSILSAPPYPLTDGYTVREYHFLKNISLRWNKALICFERNKEEYFDHLRQYFTSIKVIPKANAAFSLFNFSENMKNMIRQEIEDGDYDLLYAAGTVMLPYLTDYLDRPIVVDLVDDDTIHIFHRFKFERNLLKKVKCFKWWLQSLRFRNHYVPLFKTIVISSRRDADSVGKCCSTANQIHVIPNGVDSEYYKMPSRGVDEKEEPVLCFTGVMSFEPNEDAMINFCSAIYPLIKKRRPDVRLTIVGKEPPKSILNLSKKDLSIEVTGYVSDTRPYMWNASVYISPMRMGTGIKNKILEACAASKPIVSTRIGCAGVDIEAGENILIADDPVDFADAVVRLLGDERERRRLGRNGRELVEKHYNWAGKAENLENIFRIASDKVHDSGRNPGK